MARTLKPNVRLLDAVYRDDLAGVVQAVGDGADPMATVVVRSRAGLFSRGRKERHCPARVAAYLGRADVLAAMLEQGLDPNACWEHWSLLATVSSHRAWDRDDPEGGEQGRGQLAVMRLLLASGASPDGAAEDWISPLIAVAERGDLVGVRLLLEAGADPDLMVARDLPLTAALTAGRTEAARLLVAAGARPDAVDGLGRSARELARLLLARDEGTTPFTADPGHE